MNKVKLIVSWVVGLWFTAVVWAAPQGTVLKVNADNVNVRARPTLQSEVVGQLTLGEAVVVKSIQNEWAEIAVPERFDVWIHGEFISDNAVTASKLNVRAGAGINYHVVGVLGRGDQVTPRGEFGEWLRISPPDACSLWVSVDLLSSPEKVSNPPGMDVAQAPAGEEKPRQRQTVVLPPPPPPASKSAAKVSGPPPPPPSAATPRVLKPEGDLPPPPADLVLVPLEGQGKRIQKEGILKRVGFHFSKPADFRLVLNQSGGLQTLCYVKGNGEQLTSFLEQHLTIRGRQYWVQGVKIPVIVPEQIVPHASPQ